MKRIIFSILFFPVLAIASEGGYPLDPSPHDPRDMVSLQAGARSFVNYCLGCHSAQYVRYQSLTAIGLSEAQIRDNLMFTGDKIGEPMKGPMSVKEGKQWFGVAPPDLSVIARSRGADWLYTYLRTFYRDPKTATGWNNAVFPNVGMPHALWMLQGERGLQVEAPKDGHGHVAYKWSELSKGAQSATEYDTTARDLVNFLVYVGEPHAASRRAIGVAVLFFLGVLFAFAYLLKKEYWKDVH
ncbi:MAG: ubiquinol-cytochrome c reductase cytochrome c1 subunit [Betaproteobacteria bacterium]|jgi:ubiquinol-cytochrome c reductase cytochrome c1 subunit|nr:ubiquinol-cytochrome c reductase cytochrome c1 subunit [Betaproteobacteria bacterium]